jgi:hypothetical protein
MLPDTPIKGVNISLSLLYFAPLRQSSSFVHTVALSDQMRLCQVVLRHSSLAVTPACCVQLFVMFLLAIPFCKFVFKRSLIHPDKLSPPNL